MRHVDIRVNLNAERFHLRQEVLIALLAAEVAFHFEVSGVALIHAAVDHAEITEFQILDAVIKECLNNLFSLVKRRQRELPVDREAGKADFFVDDTIKVGIERHVLTEVGAFFHVVGIHQVRAVVVCHTDVVRLIPREECIADGQVGSRKTAVVADRFLNDFFSRDFFGIRVAGVLDRHLLFFDFDLREHRNAALAAGGVVDIVGNNWEE